MSVLQVLKEPSSSAPWWQMQRRRNRRSVLTVGSASPLDPRWLSVFYTGTPPPFPRKGVFLLFKVFFHFHLGLQKSDTESITSSEPPALTRSTSQDSEASTVVGHSQLTSSAVCACALLPSSLVCSGADSERFSLPRLAIVLERLWALTAT